MLQKERERFVDVEGKKREEGRRKLDLHLIKKKKRNTDAINPNTR